MKNLTDREIIDSVLHGNTADFNLLINRYKKKAFSMTCRIVKNGMDAEEVLQDAFLKAYMGLAAFKGDAKFSTWFYRIVYNSAISKISRKGLKIEREMTSIDEDFDLEDKNLKYYDEDINQYLEEAVEQLPPNYAAVINLFYINGYECDEIAQITGQSVANVKVLLHRSRKALKKILEKNNLHKELL